MVFVDIVTQPGLGPLRGSMDFLFRDDALNARNAFQAEKGPEQTQQYTFNLSGTLRKERTSFSLSATGASLYDSANIFAARRTGLRDRRGAPAVRPHQLQRPARSRAEQVAHAAGEPAAERQRTAQPRRRRLRSRRTARYSRTTDDSMLRLSESGPWRRNVVRRVAAAGPPADDRRRRPTLEAPTVRVLDAFTSGGAQQAGGRESTEIEWATNVDWARGKHAIRFGTLVEGGWYDSDNRTNYLGTFTFASLADYEAGRPATYTQRIGDPLVEYSHWQAGLFVQDDWRARTNLTLSAGLRQEFQTHLDDRPEPRAARRLHLVAVQARQDHRPRRRRHLLRLARRRRPTSRRCASTACASRISSITNPGYPDPFAGGASQQILPAEQIHARRRPRDAEARDGQRRRSASSSRRRSA